MVRVDMVQALFKLETYGEEFKVFFLTYKPRNWVFFQVDLESQDYWGNTALHFLAKAPWEPYKHYQRYSLVFDCFKLENPFLELLTGKSRNTSDQLWKLWKFYSKKVPIRMPKISELTFLEIVLLIFAFQDIIWLPLWWQHPSVSETESKFLWIMVLKLTLSLHVSFPLNRSGLNLNFSCWKRAT